MRTNHSIRICRYGAAVGQGKGLDLTGLHSERCRERPWVGPGHGRRGAMRSTVRFGPTLAIQEFAP
jgi:hypothetical protein